MARRKQADPNVYPKGLTAAKVRNILDHYENQTEEEAIAEADEARQREVDQREIVKVLKSHPRLLGGKNGGFVLLPLAEYQRLCGALEDALDLIDLREAREANRGKKAVPLEAATRRFGIGRKTQGRVRPARAAKRR